MSDPVYGVLGTSPDGRNPRGKSSGKEKPASEKVPDKKPPEKLSLAPDEFVPTRIPLVCEVVSYGKDPRLKRIICRAQNGVVPSDERDPPTDMEFEKVVSE